MIERDHIDVEPGIPSNAVSVFGDTSEEFPVLKAFQQYIDAEQNKARKRMVSLCIFFGCLMTVVIVVFLFLLNGVSKRNQALNDKLFEYLVKDRDHQSSAVVVQPTDNSAVYGLTQKLEEIQKKLAQSQADEAARKEADEKAAAEAQAAETATREALEKARIKEALEIERLKKELAAERMRSAREREQKRQDEIEAYRRKYYPDLYERTEAPSPSRKATRVKGKNTGDEADVDALIDELSQPPVNYFEEDDADSRPLPKSKKTTPASPSKPSSYSIPVEVKGVKTKWRIPNN